MRLEPINVQTIRLYCLLLNILLFRDFWITVVVIFAPTPWNKKRCVPSTSLRIQGVLSVDAGMFQCAATSPAGSALAALRLLVVPASDGQSPHNSQLTTHTWHLKLDNTHLAPYTCHLKLDTSDLQPHTWHLDNLTLDTSQWLRRQLWLLLELLISLPEFISANI